MIVGEERAEGNTGRSPLHRRPGRGVVVGGEEYGPSLVRVVVMQSYCGVQPISTLTRQCGSGESLRAMAFFGQLGPLPMMRPGSVCFPVQSWTHGGHVASQATLQS